MQLLHLDGCVVRAHRLGRVLEHRVVGIHLHPGHQGDDPPIQPARIQDAVHRRLDEIGDAALRLGAAIVHRHLLEAEFPMTRFVLEHHVTHLRSVPVADDDVILPAKERKELPARVLHVLELLLVGAFLVTPKQRVATEGKHG